MQSEMQGVIALALLVMASQVTMAFPVPGPSLQHTDGGMAYGQMPMTMDSLAQMGGMGGGPPRPRIHPSATNYGGHMPGYVPGGGDFGAQQQQSALMHQMMMQRQSGSFPHPINGQRPISPVPSPFGMSPMNGITSFGVQSPFSSVSPHRQLPPFQPPYGYSEIGGGASQRVSPLNIPMEVVVGQQQQQFPPQVHQLGLDGFAAASEDHPHQGQANSPMIEAKRASTASSQSSLPKFLQGAPQPAIDEFKRIIRTPNSSYAEQVKRIEKMVETLDSSRQELYRQFMKENDQIEQQNRDRIHQHVGQMSDKAQEQFAKISALLRNPGVPDHERWERVMSIYGKLDPELRSEFEEKFKGFNAGE